MIRFFILAVDFLIKIDFAARPDNKAIKKPINNPFSVILEEAILFLNLVTFLSKSSLAFQA